MNEHGCAADPVGRKCEGGSALVVVVLMTMGITAVLATMLLNSNTDHVISGNERDAERALEASKAGLNYAFHLYANNLITPTTSGTSFDSFASSVAAELDGASFSGKVYDDSAAVYRIVSTGSYNRGSRTTELVFKVISNSLTYGYMGFDEVTVHHHAKGATPFNVQSTIFSDNTVSIDDQMIINGSVVGSGSVSIPSTSKVEGDVFSYAVTNSGTINGKCGLVASVDKTAGAPSVVDNEGSKYIWYAGRSNPGTKCGGTIAGGTSRYVVKNGDVFDSKIFNSDGSLIINPPLNVIQYIAPPKIDYAAMKAEADLHDATYFTTPTLAATYLGTKKVTETVGGKSMVTIKVGTTSVPEFIYVKGKLDLTLNPAAKSDTYGSSSVLKANGLQIEGGVYASGGFEFNGPGFTNPTTNPAGYNELQINALPYCFPALIGYPEPSTGTIATWTPSSTPAMTGKSGDITMSSKNGDYEGTTLLNGLVYSAGEVHIHHTQSDKELVTFHGAELAYKIHNCDYFNFQYDQAVACTKFLGLTSGATPQVLSYREIR